MSDWTPHPKAVRTPAKLGKRTSRISLCVSTAEAVAISRRVPAGMSLSEFIRRAALGEVPQADAPKAKR